MPVLPAFALACGVVAVLASWLALGTRTLASAGLFSACFLSPMVTVRAAPSLLIADVLLIGTVAILLPSSLLLGSLRAKVAPYATVWIVVGSVFVGGLIASQAADDAVLNAVRFVASVSSAVLAVALVRPRTREIVAMASAYMAGAVVSGVAGISLELSNQGGRVYGLSGHPNHLALACAIASVAAIGFCASSTKHTARLFYGLVALCLIYVITLTGSRGGMLALVGGIGILVLVTRSGRLVALACTISAALGLAFATGLLRSNEFSVFARFTGGGLSTESDRLRSARLEAASDLIAANPFFGTGLSGAHDAHSVPVQYWQGAGLLGLFGFVLLVRMVVQPLRRGGPGLNVPTILWAAVGSYVISSLVANQLWDRYIWLPVALAVAATVDAKFGGVPEHEWSAGDEARAAAVVGPVDAERSTRATGADPHHANSRRP